MSAVVQFAEDLGNAVGDVISTVGNAVADVGNFVIDKVIEPAAKAVEKTIDAAIKDPVGTAVKIAAYSTGNPYLIAAANTGVALANGASPENALKSGAKAVVMYEVGSAVSDYVAPQAAEYFGPENVATAAAVTNAAANTAAAAAVGEDPYQALLSSGTSSAAGLIAKQVPGYDSLSAGQQRALKTTIAASLQGKDATPALVNQALQVGINYVKSDPEIQNIIPASAERPPATQEEVDALISGNAYGSDKQLSEAQQNFLESSVAGGDDSVISDILNRQLSELTPGDATPLSPVANVDLTADNIVPEGVERTPATQEEVNALIDSGLTEDTGYGYEQAPDFTTPAVTETPTTQDEIKALVDSGLVDQPVAETPVVPEVVPVETTPIASAPIEVAPLEALPPVLDTSVPEPTTDEINSLIQSGLVEEPSFKADYSLATGTDSLGLQPSKPAEVFAPDGSVNYDLVGDQTGIGLQKPEVPNLDSMGGGQGLTVPAAGQPGSTVSEGGVYTNYNPPTKTPTVSNAPSSKITYAPIQQKATQATTLDDLMSMLTGGSPTTQISQEELLKLVKASPYFDINKPLDIGFFDQPTNQGVAKMAEGGYMDILFPKKQLSMDEILEILEGKYHVR